MIPPKDITQISIEGNIGAGKSTFLKIISQSLDIQPVFEPHAKWQNVGGENLLDHFYKDTSRWAYTFQSYAFVTRIIEQDALAKKSRHPIHILERSVYSDRYCFAKNCYEMGTMNALEWKLYQEWFSWLVGSYTAPIHGFIYLKTDPEVCYKRLVKRNRSEETVVSLEYLSMIHEKHESWLIKKESIEQIPVLVLECNQDFEFDEQEQKKHINKISEFFGIPSIKPPLYEKNVSLRL